MQYFTQMRMNSNNYYSYFRCLYMFLNALFDAKRLECTCYCLNCPKKDANSPFLSLVRSPVSGVHQCSAERRRRWRANCNCSKTLFLLLPLLFSSPSPLSLSLLLLPLLFLSFGLLRGINDRLRLLRLRLQHRPRLSPPLRWGKRLGERRPVPVGSKKGID